MSPRSTAWGAYSQIADTLRQRITTGEYPPGSRLPSESALCTEFGVVRNTVRRALNILETEDLITTIPGTGRAVRHPDQAKPSTAPHYRRISDDLRAKITTGTLAEGAPLPSEAAVMSEYNVSRGTARQALADLQGAGLIHSIPGKGRYVRRRPQTP